MNAHTVGPWIVTYHYNEHGEVDGSEREPNAHLIAAAPDLYAALRAYVGACKEQNIRLGHITGDAIAALAKADGK